MARSQEGRSHGVPVAAAKGAISKRLEAVRLRLGYETYKDWWRFLTADGEFVVSYEAVRNYQYGRVGGRDRDPPVSYLVRVAEMTGVSLRWLADGSDYAFPEDVPPADEHNRRIVGRWVDAVERVARRLGLSPESPGGGTLAFSLNERMWALKELLTRDLRYRGETLEKAGPDSEPDEDVEAFVCRHLRAVVEDYPVDLADLRPWQMEMLVQGYVLALGALVPDPTVQLTVGQEASNA